MLRRMPLALRREIGHKLFLLENDLSGSVKKLKGSRHEYRLTRRRLPRAFRTRRPRRDQCMLSATAKTFIDVHRRPESEVSPANHSAVPKSTNKSAVERPCCASSRQPWKTSRIDANSPPRKSATGVKSELRCAKQLKNSACNQSAARNETASLPGTPGAGSPSPPLDELCRGRAAGVV